MIEYINSNPLMISILCAIFAGIICGIMGLLIVSHNLIMMTGGISHTSLGGIGLGLLLGFKPIIGASVFAVTSAFIIDNISEKYKEKSDVVISLLWAFGMALGIVFVTLSGKMYALDEYLFGDILSVSFGKLLFIFIAALVTILAIWFFYEIWVIYLFDKEFASVSGINTKILDKALLLLISMCIVALIHVVGIILVVALLTAPAVTAKRFTTNFKSQIALSVILSVSYCISGVIIGNYLNLNAGAITALISICIYFIVIKAKLKAKSNVYY